MPYVKEDALMGTNVLKYLRFGLLGLYELSAGVVQ